MGDTSEDKLDYDEYNFTEIKACTAGLDTVLDIAFAEAFETSGKGQTELYVMHFQGRIQRI